MADFLNTSISGLLAFQRSLDTVSHNISNANTPGYSRQIADLATRQAQPTGSGWVGNGVDVTNIKRQYDDFLSGQTRMASSSYQQADAFATQASRLNNLFGDESTGLTASLQKFINAIQGVADTPTSVPARQTLLSEADSLVQRLQSYDTSLRGFDSQANGKLDAEATAITTIAQNIAKLNEEISSGYARTGKAPNDLLDKRDKLLDDLATHVNVNVVKQGDNTVNVFIGNGQPLVVGQVPAKLATVGDPFDVSRKVMTLQTASGSVDISNNLSGGTLGGILDFRTQMLDPARNTLGRLAVGLADVMNAQHHEGMDLNGALGDDFFSVGSVLTQRGVANSGTAAVTTTRVPGATSALTTADYILSYSSGGWNLLRTDSGTAVAMTGSGTAADPFIAEGLSIEVSGTPALADRFIIKPTAEAVAGLQVLVTDPSEVAVAAPIVSRVAAGNTGSGKISVGEVLDASDPQLRTTATIQFVNATQYTISGDPTVYNYTSGTDIDANGWRVQISGALAAGDSFTVSDNRNGVGDNRNALELVQVLNQPVLNGGSASLNAAAGQFVGRIGVQTSQSQVTSAAQKVVYDEGVGEMQAVSGVNLDEEAADLVRYQQAYMATAQMIRVADTIFQSVIAALRG